MRMNIMRESQRMMLTQAETIVRLNQLREEVIKALPPKNVKAVIPTSNAALEETLGRTKGTQTQVVMEEEGKPAPPVKPRLNIITKGSKSVGSSPISKAIADEAAAAQSRPSIAKAAAKAAKAAKAANKPSPTASQAPTVASSQDPSLLSTDSNQPGSPRDDDLDISVHFGRERKLLKDAVKRSGARKDGMSEISQGKALAAIKEAKSVAELKAIEHELINGKSKFQASDLIGNGLMRLRAKSSGAGLKRHRAKSGRFVKSKR